jgi:recombinational DNA repair protein RecT
MSTEVQKPRSFRENVTIDALAILADMYGVERAKVAAGRLALSFDAAVRTAKDPQALLDCSPASVRACITTSAITQLYPGGPSPDVYLVPRMKVLQWSLTHVGMAKLAARQGYALIVVPVHVDDKVKVEFGEAVAHEQDPRRTPRSLDELAGVIVVLRRIADGAVISRPFISQAIIQTRAKAKGAGPVWNQWPVEMALKTAIRYSYARGMLPLTGEDWQAAMMGDEPEVIDVEADAATATKPAKQSTRALLTDDYAPIPDFAAESSRLAERETVAADPEPEAKPKAKPAARVIDVPADDNDSPV